MREKTVQQSVAKKADWNLDKLATRKVPEWKGFSYGLEKG